MATATLTAPIFTARPLALAAAVLGHFLNAHRYEALFAMSDAQLAARGLDRDALVRSFIGGLGHN